MNTTWEIKIFIHQKWNLKLIALKLKFETRVKDISFVFTSLCHQN